MPGECVPEREALHRPHVHARPSLLVMVDEAREVLAVVKSRKVHPQADAANTAVDGGTGRSVLSVAGDLVEILARRLAFATNNAKRAMRPHSIVVDPMNVMRLHLHRVAKGAAEVDKVARPHSRIAKRLASLRSSFSGKWVSAMGGKARTMSVHCTHA